MAVLGVNITEISKNHMLDKNLAVLQIRISYLLNYSFAYNDCELRL